MAAGPAGRVSRPQIAGQFLAQRAAGLHEQRQIDRLVRHAHLRIVRELFHQPTRDLLRRPPQLELRLHRPPATAHRPPASTASGGASDAPPPCPRDTLDSAADHRSRRPHATIVDGARPSRRAIARNDSPPARPREISSRSANDNRNGDRTGSRTGGRRNRADACPTPHDVPAPISLPINATRQPLRRQLRDPPLLQLRQPLHNTPPDRSNSIERRDALTP